MSQLSVPRRALLSIAAAPLVLPGRVFGANDRIRIGVIGAGGRSNLLMDQLPPSAEIVAVADCYPKRADDAVSKRKANWSIHHDHRSLLDMKDIDGVIVGTADHQRVLCSIHACQAGKDVYAEKPSPSTLPKAALWSRPHAVTTAFSRSAASSVRWP